MWRMMGGISEQRGLGSVSRMDWYSRTMFATNSPSPSLFRIVSVPKIAATSSPASIASAWQ